MGIIDGATLHHTCFVVHDVEKAARSLAGSLGIGPWGIWTIEPSECTVRGRPVPYAFRVAIAEVGASRYELIEPAGGDSVYVEHLRARGEGFHHTCIAYETQEAMRQARAELARQGRRMIQSGTVGAAGEFCYFEIEETGEVLELLFLRELPPPETTIG